MVPAPHRQQSQRIAARIAARLAAKLSAFGQGMQLPPRVRRELEREQYLSELLVTSLQLLVLLLFAVLYLETPRAFHPTRPYARYRSASRCSRCWRWSGSTLP